MRAAFSLSISVESLLGGVQLGPREQLHVPVGHVEQGLVEPDVVVDPDRGEVELALGVVDPRALDLEAGEHVLHGAGAERHHRQPVEVEGEDQADQREHADVADHALAHRHLRESRVTLELSHPPGPFSAGPARR
jgi:hypothetical protein